MQDTTAAAAKRDHSEPPGDGGSQRRRHEWQELFLPIPVSLHDAIGMLVGKRYRHFSDIQAGSGAQLQLAAPATAVRIRGAGEAVQLAGDLLRRHFATLEEQSELGVGCCKCAVVSQQQRLFASASHSPAHLPNSNDPPCPSCVLQRCGLSRCLCGRCTCCAARCTGKPASFKCPHQVSIQLRAAAQLQVAHADTSDSSCEQTFCTWCFPADAPVDLSASWLPRYELAPPPALAQQLQRQGAGTTGVGDLAAQLSNIVVRSGNTFLADEHAALQCLVDDMHSACPDGQAVALRCNLGEPCPAVSALHVGSNTALPLLLRCSRHS